MEIKWLMIGWAVIMLGLAADHAYEAKTKSDCRLAYAQSTKTGDEIEKICK